MSLGYFQNLRRSFFAFQIQKIFYKLSVISRRVCSSWSSSLWVHFQDTGNLLAYLERPELIPDFQLKLYFNLNSSVYLHYLLTLYFMFQLVFKMHSRQIYPAQTLTSKQPLCTNRHIQYAQSAVCLTLCSHIMCSVSCCDFIFYFFYKQGYRHTTYIQRCDAVNANKCERIDKARFSCWSQKSLMIKCYSISCEGKELHETLKAASYTCKQLIENVECGGMCLSKVWFVLDVSVQPWAGATFSAASIWGVIKWQRKEKVVSGWQSLSHVLLHWALVCVSLKPLPSKGPCITECKIITMLLSTHSISEFPHSCFFLNTLHWLQVLAYHF